MYWSHADVMTYRDWFERAGLMIEAEGSEPRNGNPGYAVLIARTPLIDEQHREVALGSGTVAQLYPEASPRAVPNGMIRIPE